jgi:hypothetical protein
MTSLRLFLKVISFQRRVGCLFCLHGTQFWILMRALGSPYRGVKPYSRSKPWLVLQQLTLLSEIMQDPLSKPG